MPVTNPHVDEERRNREAAAANKRFWDSPVGTLAAIDCANIHAELEGRKELHIEHFAAILGISADSVKTALVFGAMRSKLEPCGNHDGFWRRGNGGFAR